jgi:hypothetical protein
MDDALTRQTFWQRPARQPLALEAFLLFGVQF